MEFETVFEKVKYVIPQAIRTCHIYKNFEHYEQIGREAIWRAFEKFTGPEEEFAPYAYVFTRNAILNELRKCSRIDEQEQLIHEPTFFEILQKPSFTNDISYPLEKLLSPLKQEDRLLLYLLYVEQYSYEETAKRLHISVHAVKKRRDRLMTALRARRTEVFED